MLRDRSQLTLERMTHVEPPSVLPIAAIDTYFWLALTFKRQQNGLVVDMVE